MWHDTLTQHVKHNEQTNQSRTQQEEQHNRFNKLTVKILIRLSIYISPEVLLWDSLYFSTTRVAMRGLEKTTFSSRDEERSVGRSVSANPSRIAGLKQPNSI